MDGRVEGGGTAAATWRVCLALKYLKILRQTRELRAIVMRDNYSL